MGGGAWGARYPRHFGNASRWPRTPYWLAQSRSNQRNSVDLSGVVSLLIRYCAGPFGLRISMMMRAPGREVLSIILSAADVTVRWRKSCHFCESAGSGNKPSDGGFSRNGVTTTGPQLRI